MFRVGSHKRNAQWTFDEIREGQFYDGLTGFAIDEIDHLAENTLRQGFKTVGLQVDHFESVKALIFGKDDVKFKVPVDGSEMLSNMQLREVKASKLVQGELNSYGSRLFWVTLQTIAPINDRWRFVWDFYLFDDTLLGIVGVLAG